MLVSKNGQKWKSKGLTPAKLFKEFLRTANSIFKHFTVAELHIVSDIYSKFPGGKMNMKKVIERGF